MIVDCGTLVTERYQGPTSSKGHIRRWGIILYRVQIPRSNGRTETMFKIFWSDIGLGPGYYGWTVFTPEYVSGDL